MDKSKIVSTLPSTFPYAWCSDYGEDEYGVFMGFTFKGVRQGFRWVPPGTFMMGSPEGEVGRDSGGVSLWKETLHRVILRKGYWMAETTCTQALWQAVMEENPSAFVGEDRPVEQVSWYQVQAFIRKLHSWEPALALRLPSEAQWERACRTDTLTAFWFGDKMEASRVHFRNVRKTGTLSVKALEPNPWGLYQMHGNVWEWCEDWVGIYPRHTIDDPLGPVSGYLRVIRGGSWFNYGRVCRSANRHGLTPSDANHFTGFRLARSL